MTEYYTMASSEKVRRFHAAIYGDPGETLCGRDSFDWEERDVWDIVPSDACSKCHGIAGDWWADELAAWQQQREEELARAARLRTVTVEVIEPEPTPPITVKVELTDPEPRTKVKPVYNTSFLVVGYDSVGAIPYNDRRFPHLLQEMVLKQSHGPYYLTTGTYEETWRDALDPSKARAIAENVEVLLNDVITAYRKEAPLQGEGDRILADDATLVRAVEAVLDERIAEQGHRFSVPDADDGSRRIAEWVVGLMADAVRESA